MGLNGFGNNNTAMGNGALFLIRTAIATHVWDLTRSITQPATATSPWVIQPEPISPPAVTTSILATKVKLASPVRSALAQKELTRIRLSRVLVE